jgi:hypothetical protein
MMSQVLLLVMYNEEGRGHDRQVMSHFLVPSTPSYQERVLG